MQLLINWIFSPIAFSIGFLTPLIAQICATLDMQFGSLPVLAASLLIAVTLGVVAQVRGNWLWQRP